MSVESAKNFLKKFAKDDDFRAQLEKAADLEARQVITKAAGFDFTKAELHECVGASSELSDDDLENVAGGKTVEWVSAGAGVTAAGAGTVAAVAAL